MERNVFGRVMDRRIMLGNRPGSLTNWSILISFVYIQSIGRGWHKSFVIRWNHWQVYWSPWWSAARWLYRKHVWQKSFQGESKAKICQSNNDAWLPFRFLRSSSYRLSGQQRSLERRLIFKAWRVLPRYSWRNSELHRQFRENCHRIIKFCPIIWRISSIDWRWN